MEVIIALLGILGVLLKWFLEVRKPGKPPTVDERYEQDLTRFNEAIASGDADTLSAMFRELRPPPSTNSGDSRGQDDKAAP